MKYYKNYLMILFKIVNKVMLNIFRMKKKEKDIVKKLNILKNIKNRINRH